MMVLPARFIVVEGTEGAGKSTAVEAVFDYLSHKSIPCIKTREPGGTKIGERLRNLIKLGLDDERLFPQSELLLIYASRVQLVEQVIKPALAQGTWVISDRFDLSTYAYQGGGRQIDSSFIDHLSSFCLKNISPDCVFFMDLPPEAGLLRAGLRGELDHIEQESQDFFQRVYEVYKSRVALTPQAVRIDATLSKEEVVACIIQHLEPLMHV